MAGKGNQGMQKEADVSNLNQTGISAMLGCELHWLQKKLQENAPEHCAMLGMFLQSCLAEEKGFEPLIRFPVYTLSRRASSTTPALLRDPL